MSEDTTTAPPAADPGSTESTTPPLPAADPAPVAVAASAAESDDPMVAALLREREGYLQRDLIDRVAQVDEQLMVRGFTPPPAVKRGRSRRGSAPQQTR